MKKFSTTLTSLLAIALIATVTAEEEITKHPTRKDVTGVDGEDKEMIAAQKKASDTLMEFIAAIKDRKEGDRYLLKVRLEEEGEVEHVWLEPVKFEAPGLKGILAVTPVAIKKHKKGDVIAPKPSEITDWVILSDDGTKKGGYTMDVIEKRRATKE